MNLLNQSASAQESFCSSTMPDSRALGGLFYLIVFLNIMMGMKTISELNYWIQFDIFELLKLGHINTPMKLHWGYEWEIMIFLLCQA